MSEAPDHGFKKIQCLRKPVVATEEYYRCSNFPVGYDPNVSCVISSHGSGCMIVNRMAYKIYGTCSSCTYGTPPLIAIYGTHIETCYHTGTPEIPYYITCYYK